MNYFDAKFEVKDMTDTGSFAGFGSVYGNVDDGNDIVAPECFSASLSNWSAKGRMPALLWQHRTDQPIGAYQKMQETQQGLYVEGTLALKTQCGMEAYELLKMKAISGLSIGFSIVECDYNVKTDIRTIKIADLWEVSLVTFPMNDMARVASVKSLELIEKITDFKSAEDFLRDSCKFSRKEATAFLSRVKSHAQRDSVADEEVDLLISALSRRTELIKS